MSTSPRSGKDLTRRVFGGFAWVGASSIAQQVIRMLSAIVVARLLTPDEYGLAMLALVFVSLVLVFSDLALGAALIQRKTLTEDDRSTAFWITVGSGTVFTVLGFGLSWPVAALYGQPEAQPLLAALSFSFLVTSLGATQQALLLRDMAFRRLESLTVVGIVFGSAAAIGLALADLGAWAIIGQQLVIAAVTSVLMWRASSWRPQLRFSKASMRDLGGFSAYLVGHRLLFYLHQNADRFIIGKFIGTAALGVYAVAYNVMLSPASRIGGPLQRLLAPAFAEMQDEPARIAAAWARVTRVIGVIVVPSLAGLVVLAPDFVPVVLGSQWEAAVPIVQILAWVGALQALQSLNMDILIARDRTRTIFRYSIAFTCVHITAFVIGLHWGIIGIAVAYAISSTFIEPVLTVLTARAIDASPMVFVRSVWGVFVASAGMAAAVLGGRIALVDAGVPAAARLALLIPLGVLVFLPLCAWRVPELADEVRAVSRRLGLRRPIAPTPVES